MKGSVDGQSNGRAGSWRNRLRLTAVLAGIVLLSLILGSMAVDLPLSMMRHQEVGAAAPAKPKLKGIENPKNLPLLLDFGMGICIPCRMMKSILEEVAQDYDGKLLVKILEIDQHRDLVRQFRIHLIPTQIFINSKGEIVHRHEGFMDKASILRVLSQMGVKK
jgi:thioredoxin 1